MRHNVSLLVLLIIRLYPGLDIDSFSQGNCQDTFRLVFYNVENLFDPVDDTTTDDNDFLPDGSMHWTRSRYQAKLNSVYRVITAAGGWEPPALVAFCEIENRRVLSDLISFTYLSKFQFGIVTGETLDRRGIRNGIIYRKDLIRMLSVEDIMPEAGAESSFSGRLILFTSMLICGDTVDLFFNHWPSRRAGVLAGKGQRQLLSDAIRKKIDSLLAYGHNHSIIIAGDFNCIPGDPEINRLTSSGRISDKGSVLVNLTELSARRGEGSYRYRGNWEMFDQVIVSNELTESDTNRVLHAGRLVVFKPLFLFYNDPSYAGLSPYPSYSGRKYLGGFSDHLPVVLDLVKVRRAPRN